MSYVIKTNAKIQTRKNNLPTTITLNTDTNCIQVCSNKIRMYFYYNWKLSMNNLSIVFINCVFKFHSKMIFCKYFSEKFCLLGSTLI